MKKIIQIESYCFGMQFKALIFVLLSDKAGVVYKCYNLLDKLFQMII